MFLGKRSDLTLERNRLVAVFLRKLEYFDGVLFLTTNLVGHLDEAILNRIHLALTYESLDRNARRTILAQFLKMTGTDRDQPNLSAEEVERLAQIQLNGRQVSVYATDKDLCLRMICSRSRIPSPSPMPWSL